MNWIQPSIAIPGFSYWEIKRRQQTLHLLDTRPTPPLHTKCCISANNHWTFGNRHLLRSRQHDSSVKSRLRQHAIITALIFAAFWSQNRRKYRSIIIEVSLSANDISANDMETAQIAAQKFRSRKSRRGEAAIFKRVLPLKTLQVYDRVHQRC